MGVCGQPSSLAALLLGVKLPVSTEEEAEWAVQPVGKFWKREDFLPVLGFEHRIVYPQCSRDIGFALSVAVLTPVEDVSEI